jgi:hypothetical protein
MPTLELVSLHVPKTGGTSFLKALLDHYGDDLIVDHDHAPGLGANLKAPIMLPDHAKAVHGHFAGDRYRDFSDAFHVTFLRDPVEQVISTYYFWLTLPPSAHPLHQRLLTEMPDVVSFARYDTGGTLQGFFREVDPGYFDYVGFTDRRSLDCLELSRLLGFEIDAAIHANPTILPPHLAQQRVEVETNPHTQAALKDTLRNDYYYYDRFRSYWT